MRKPKLVSVTGVVALSYLLLVPAGAFVLWRKVQIIDEDLSHLWDKMEMVPPSARPIINTAKIKRFFGK